MKRPRLLSALLGGAFLFLSLSMERPGVYAQKAASSKAASRKTSSTATLKPLLIDLDGLKAILRRDPQHPRPLLLNFWATWCDPCREEFPDLLKIESDYRARGLEFAAVSFDFSEDVQTALPEFLRQMKADVKPYWVNLPDPEPAIRMVDPEWTGGIPSTFLFDASGKLLFKHIGKIKPAELRAAIDQMLAAKR